MVGFKQKYKTEICRNWELTGYCAFRDSVNFLKLKLTSCSVHLHMVKTKYKESSMCLQIIRLDFANNFMRIFTVPMV